MTLADLQSLNFEKINKLPVTQKLLILGGLLILIFGLYFYFFYVPKSKQLSGLKAQLSTLESERITKKATADNLPTFQKEIKRLNEKLKRALVKLPSQAEIDQLLIEIPVKASESGLEILSFKLESEIRRGFYAEVPISISLSGRYMDITSFFDRMANMPRIVHVDNINLKPQAGKINREVVLDSSIVITTYRFLEDISLSQ
ncbi:MAG: type 4a pilus biogenesis protein PilO [bacterium]|nr:type 4a pilus biogenesis protein PilO [bacterium]